MTERDPFVITSPSGRTRAVVTIAGTHRCVRWDDRGNLLGARPTEAEEPSVSTEIEVAS